MVSLGTFSNEVGGLTVAEVVGCVAFGKGLKVVAALLSNWEVGMPRFDRRC